MVLRRIPIFLAIASLMLLRATATVMPVPDIDKLVASSNLIVLGELLTVERGESRSVEASGSSIQVRADHLVLKIDDFLRGASGSPVRVEILIPQKEVGWEVPAQRNFGLFFLRTDDNGKTSLADKYYPFIPVPRGIYGRGDTPQDRVTSILAEMLVLPNDPSANNLALSFLMESKSKSANTALRVALDTATFPEFRIQIANAMLVQGDASSLKYIKQVFLTGPRISVKDEQQEVLGNVMAFYLRDQGSIPDLEQLMDSYSVHIRRGSAQALRRTASPKAIKGLAKALEDKDSQVRYWGAVGLAELTGQPNWQPTEETFKTREPEYLNHWKEWARNRR